jgi:hypothetical protein
MTSLRGGGILLLLSLLAATNEYRSTRDDDFMERLGSLSLFLSVLEQPTIILSAVKGNCVRMTDPYFAYHTHDPPSDNCVRVKVLKASIYTSISLFEATCLVVLSTKSTIISSICGVIGSPPGRWMIESGSPFSLISARKSAAMWDEA